MPNCKHNSYRDHQSFFGAFCKGNSDRWYPVFALTLMFFTLLVFLGIPITLLVWFFG